MKPAFKGSELSKYNPAFVQRSFAKRMKDLNIFSLDEYEVLITNNTDEKKVFLDSLLINYSEFFRNSFTWAILEQYILPKLVSKKLQSGRKEIRIWSTSCAGGQETYSLAILLEELLESRGNSFTYRIFGTDIVEKQIDQARDGRYDHSDVQNCTLKRLKKWFVSEGDSFVVKPVLKKNIEYSLFDLFDRNISCPTGSIFGDFDLIICANLLFYFADENQNLLLNRILNCMSKQGYLMTGETEREIVSRFGYREIHPYASVFSFDIGRRNKI